MQLNSLGLQNTALDGVLLIQGQRQTDARGTTHSLFDAPHFAAFGLSTRFVADHFTRANQGSLYGLYYARDAHKGMEMAQLFTAIRGSVFVVAVDLRARRPTFGQAIGFTLNDTMPQAYLAPGIAWGLCGHQRNGRHPSEIYGPASRPPDGRHRLERPRIADSMAVPAPGGEQRGCTVSVTGKSHAATRPPAGA